MIVFTSTLNQTAFLFALIILGFVLAKCKIIPKNSAEVLAKLENNIFVPALILGTFIKNFTIKQIGTAANILLISLIIGLVMIPVSVLTARCITKDAYKRNIFTYGLTFSNFGFMGNAVVSALFPDIFLEYVIFTLPLWTLIYLWGVPVLLIGGSGEKQPLRQRLKAFLNPMFGAMILGMIIGILGISLPQWASSAIESCGGCMSPVAMLLTGVTVSGIDYKKTFKNIEIYIVSIVRLVVFPVVFLFVGRYLHLSHTIFVCTLCSMAMPLGLNTIIIPNAYGKDTSDAAGMTIISHLLSCITIPVIFMLIEYAM